VRFTDHSSGNTLVKVITYGIRLYSQEDFEARSEFTEPEILRTNLASVILQMTSLGLADIAGARTTDSRKRHTLHDTRSQDRKIAALPLDSCLAQLVLETGGNGALRDVLIMARRQKR
jgi:ATP-dependent helicase HrpA